MSEPTRESIKDLAAAYAIGALDVEEARAFEKLLAESEEAQRQVKGYREVGALLVHGAPAATPDPTLRARLMRRVHSRSASTKTRGRSGYMSWPVWLAWAAAVGGIAIGGMQTFRGRSLVDQIAALEEDIGELSVALAGSAATLDNILEPSTVLFLLTSTDAQPPGIQLFWNQRDNNVVLHAFSLNQAPAGRVYQLWYLRDGAPIPASTFNSETDGHQLVTLPGPPGDVEVIGAAVTLEPVGGSTVPTPPILMVGLLQPNP